MWIKARNHKISIYSNSDLQVFWDGGAGFVVLMLYVHDYDSYSFFTCRLHVCRSIWFEDDHVYVIYCYIYIITCQCAFVKTHAAEQAARQVEYQVPIHVRCLRAKACLGA